MECVPTRMPMLKAFVDKIFRRRMWKRVYENEHSLYDIVREETSPLVPPEVSGQVLQRRGRLSFIYLFIFYTNISFVNAAHHEAQLLNKV